MYYSETRCKIWTFSSIVRNTTRKQDVQNTGNGGKGEVYGTLYFLLNFSINLKLKNVSLKKENVTKINQFLFLFCIGIRYQEM